MNSKFWAVLFILIMAAGVVAEYTLIEANEYLNLARSYYAEDDEKNALKNAHLARRIYENLSYSYGVRQCDQLLSDIQKTITKNIEADIYFTIASEYFLTPNPSSPNPQRDIELYELSKYFGREALKIYEILEHTTGIFKSNDIVDRSSREILRIRNAERERAESYRVQAQTLYIKKEYNTALNFAKSATDVYKNISDASGTIISQQLEKRIENTIYEIRQNGFTTYQNAKLLYGEGNLTRSLTLAEKAKELYSSIEDADGLGKAEDLISLIHQMTDRAVTDRKRLAQELIQKAEQGFVLGNYETATENVFEAREIYYEFYRLALKGSAEKKYYWEVIIETNLLYDKITTAMGDKQTKKSAESYYDRAQEFFIAGQANDALSYARRAKDLYTTVDDYVGVEKSNALINTIIDRVSRENSASGNLTEALSYCRVSDYENARISLDVAKQLFSTLIGTNKSADIDNVTNCIEYGEKRKVEARQYFEKGYELFQSQDYRGAKKSAETAYNIYAELNHSLGVTESGALLEKATIEVNRLNNRLWMTVVSVVIVLVIIAILVINYTRKRKEIVEEAEKSKRARVEEERFAKKKWEVEKEEETEEKVKDELKRMIEAEREKMVKK
ncbi:MAG: hypothetical protein V1921_03435 [Candidatus Altiarchaeota archaeon]